MKRKLGVAVCVVAAFADTYPRQPGVDALHYTFRLTLSDTTDQIDGEASIDVRFTQDQMKELILDLTSITSDGKGMTVTWASAPYSHVDNRLHLAVDPPARSGERRQLEETGWSIVFWNTHAPPRDRAESILDELRSIVLDQSAGE